MSDIDFNHLQSATDGREQRNRTAEALLEVMAERERAALARAERAEADAADAKRWKGHVDHLLARAVNAESLAAERLARAERAEEALAILRQAAEVEAANLAKDAYYCQPLGPYAQLRKREDALRAALRAAAAPLADTNPEKTE